MACQKFSEFPNLRNVSLFFDNHCYTPGERLPWPEDVLFRFKVMMLLFDVLGGSNGRIANLSSLTIKNIQNLNDKELVDSEGFKRVLRRLRALNLFIIVEMEDEDDFEEEEDVVQYFFDKDEVHTFFEELPSVWLMHTSANLTHLSLYCVIPFGFCPHLDLRGIHFPYLRTLSLGNYVFSHDWQIR